MLNRRITTIAENIKEPIIEGNVPSFLYSNTRNDSKDSKEALYTTIRSVSDESAPSRRIYCSGRMLLECSSCSTQTIANWLRVSKIKRHDWSNVYYVTQSCNHGKDYWLSISKVLRLFFVNIDPIFGIGNIISILYYRWKYVHSFLDPEYCFSFCI